METGLSELRQVMNASAVRARVLSVASGKGGVGKTNISANLAICLAASNKRVLLLDADMSLGNVDVLMNVSAKYNISHVFSGRKTLEEIIHVGPAGVEMICGVSGMEAIADLSEFQRQRLLRELSGLQDSSDIIIIDNAAGISKSVVGFCLASDHTLVITTPEATAMTDAYAMIKVLAGNNFAGRISLIVNMADSVAEGRRTYQQIAGVASRFLNTHVYDAGVVLRDEKLAASVRMRKPVVLAYPTAKSTSSLAALAAKLGRGAAAPGENEGFFRKVADWFF
jgi:flagellar biosynthesis protein FlhG